MSGAKLVWNHGRHCASGPPWTTTTTEERALALRPEKEDGDRLAVEARKAVQLGLDERSGIDRARTRRHTLELVRVEVVHVHVERLRRRRERKREQRAVPREHRAVDDTAPGQRHLFAQLERARVAKLEPRVAVLVDPDEHAAASLVGGAVEIPLGVEHDLP